jgi:hypothetical protein
MHTPPDPLWPSAIVNIVVHQIVNLQLANIKGSDGNRKGKEYEPAKPFGENTEEQGGELPTSYCKIMLNDQPVSINTLQLRHTHSLFVRSTVLEPRP